MSAPIDRDQQIGLMEKVKERLTAKAADLTRVPVIRDAIKRPAPGQAENGYVQRTVVKRRCA